MCSTLSQRRRRMVGLWGRSLHIPHHFDSSCTQDFQRGQVGQLDRGRNLHGAEDFPGDVEQANGILLVLHGAILLTVRLVDAGLVVAHRVGISYFQSLRKTIVWLTPSFSAV